MTLAIAGKPGVLATGRSPASTGTFAVALTLACRAML